MCTLVVRLTGAHQRVWEHACSEVQACPRPATPPQAGWAEYGPLCIAAKTCRSLRTTSKRVDRVGLVELQHRPFLETSCLTQFVVLAGTRSETCLTVDGPTTKISKVFQTAKAVRALAEDFVTDAAPRAQITSCALADTSLQHMQPPWSQTGAGRPI